MRVLYLNPFSQEVSGPDESLRVLLGELVPMGVEACVVLPTDGPQVARYLALGVEVRFAPLAVLRRDLSAGTALFPARLLHSAHAVRRIAQEVGADLIHTNMEVLLEGGIAARTLGIPHVLHYRGNTLDRPKWIFDALTAIWTGMADQVFCISNATAGVFERRGRARKVEVIYNPIDVRAFATAPRLDDLRAVLGARPGDRLIGTVGRIHPRKDLETFIRAAAWVLEHTSNVHFVLVGSAEAPVERAYEARLRTLVSDLGIAGQVTFAGARRDIPSVMAALDLFVLTSRHEGFGRVVAEAMAASLPMVVTDEGAPPELLERGKYGLCAGPGDADDFAHRIMGLLADPDGAAALGALASRQALLFDSRLIAWRVYERYRTLVEARSLERTAPPTARPKC